jgi:hypothetical protein
MAGIIKTSINLAKIPKDKIIDGAKGKYLPITITVNDEVEETFKSCGLTVHSLNLTDKINQDQWLQHHHHHNQ